MFNNICLIGLPHSGKTAIGNKLYKHLHKGILNINDIIRNKYKTDIPLLITTQGRSKFIEIESDIITSLKVDNSVIITSSSVVFNSDSMDYLKKDLDSTVYHLFLSKKEYVNRLTSKEKRGVIMSSSQPIPHNTIYNESIYLFNKYADKTISSCRDIHLDRFKEGVQYPTYKTSTYQELYGNKSPRVKYGVDSYYWNPISPDVKPIASVTKVETTDTKEKSSNTFQGNQKYNI